MGCWIAHVDFGGGQADHRNFFLPLLLSVSLLALTALELRVLRLLFVLRLLLSGALDLNSCSNLGLVSCVTLFWAAVNFDDCQISFVLAGRIRFSFKSIQLNFSIPKHLLLLVLGRADLLSPCPLLLLRQLDDFLGEEWARWDSLYHTMIELALVCCA